MAIPFVIINLDKPRNLRFTQRVAQEFEQVTSKPVSVVEVEQHICPKCGHEDVKYEISFENVNYMLWLMLKREDPSLSFEDAMDLVDEYSPSITYSSEKTMEAYRLGLSGETKPKNGKKPTAK